MCTVTVGRFPTFYIDFLYISGIETLCLGIFQHIYTLLHTHSLRFPWQSKTQRQENGKTFLDNTFFKTWLPVLWSRQGTFQIFSQADGEKKIVQVWIILSVCTLQLLEEKFPVLQ